MIPHAWQFRSSIAKRASGLRIFVFSVMNETKWNELRLKMYSLETHSPKWRAKDIESGYISSWDGEWYYHFEVGGFRCIGWVELKTKGSIHHE